MRATLYKKLKRREATLCILEFIMNGEKWSFPQTNYDLKKSETAFNNENENENDYRKLMAKTELCKKFRRGNCNHGAKCNFAHNIQELKRQPRLCRLFYQKRQCHYGRNCRFLHSTTTLSPFNNPFSIPTSQPQPQLQPEFKRMRTSAAAPSDDNTSSEHRIMQPSNAVKNASTSSSHKNEKPYAVKSRFKENDLERISRIYADWIWDLPCSTNWLN